jgi:N-acetyltransferase
MPLVLRYGVSMFTGRFVQLEPLSHDHAAELAVAAGPDRSTYSWGPVPRDLADAEATIATRLALQETGSWIPFVQRRLTDNHVVGMTNYLNVERWNGADKDPTSVEIGGTWINPSAQRSAINTEAKLLLMQHAFEVWGVHRLQIKTDARNTKSRDAIERLGATFEGVLRNYQMGNGDLGEGSPRDTAMYAVLPAEWPAIKAGLVAKLNR